MIQHNNRPVDLYLVSSTLHFFWAYVLADRFKGERDSRVWLIDQYTNKPMIFTSFLQGESASDLPFVETEVIAGREVGGLKKLWQRRRQFAWIRSQIKKNKPDRVFIGNDRSVFGQYTIKCAKEANPECKACYLDDGVFTYLGRAASQKKSERYVDALLKKLIYGFWYDPPPTVGASKWIDEAWVMYPQEVNPYLQSKPCQEIYPENNGFQAIERLALKVFHSRGRRKFEINAQALGDVDVLVTLPNETLFSKMPGYPEKMVSLVKHLVERGLVVAVKYHPAAGKRDPLALKGLGGVFLPSDISFELLLPFLNHTSIIGDVSTTVLLAHYAQSVNQVMMLKMTKGDYSDRMTALCSDLAMEVISMDEEGAILKVMVAVSGSQNGRE